MNVGIQIFIQVPAFNILIGIWVYTYAEQYGNSSF